jgi:hypothetical protein
VLEPDEFEFDSRPAPLVMFGSPENFFSGGVNFPKAQASICGGKRARTQ